MASSMLGTGVSSPLSAAMPVASGRPGGSLGDGGPCPLCAVDGGTVVWQAARWRVVRAGEPGFPAFYRVVWQAHVAEWSDLSADDRNECMAAVLAVEQALRAHLAPTKVNLASLGNVVAHLHWHAIARFAGDSHFPSPVWAEALRPRDTAHEARIEALRPALEADMAARLAVVAALPSPATATASPFVPAGSDTGSASGSHWPAP